MSLWGYRPIRPSPSRSAFPFRHARHPSVNCFVIVRRTEWTTRQSTVSRGTRADMRLVVGNQWIATPPQGASDHKVWWFISVCHYEEGAERETWQSIVFRVTRTACLFASLITVDHHAHRELAITI